MKRLKNPKEASEFRSFLFEKQEGLDPITGEKITDPVLDHSHSDRYCRQVLQREINSFEGKVSNAFDRYVKHLTDLDLPEVLINLAEYLRQDYSHNPIHHTELTKDVKSFLRLRSRDQILYLKDLGYDEKICKNQKIRGNLIRKHLKDNTVLPKWRNKH